MSENHEAIVRRVFEDVWNKGKLDTADQLLAADFVNNDPANQTRGLKAYKDVVTKYRTAFPDCRLDITELISTGDKVVARFRFSGKHNGPLEGIKPTGRQVTGSGIGIYSVSGDRIRESFVNWDALGMMQQLGAVTLPGRAMEAGV